MERINPFAFYELSKGLKAIAAFSADMPINECFYLLVTASGLMDRLLGGDPIQIGVSRQSASQLHHCLETIIGDHITEPDPAGGVRFRPNAPPVPAWNWVWFRSVLATFETVFHEEMRETATYFVPRRGIFYTPALIDSADESFPDEVRGKIPEKTRVDWKAAGRCLAFNLHSASGFHVARAVEGTLEAYYQLFSGNAGETLNSWHDYVKALAKIAEAKPEPCPSEKTLAELVQMKDDYRNPIVHPRVVLSEADARMLFNNGESLIIAMAQEIGEARKGVQPALVGLAPAPAAGVP